MYKIQYAHNLSALVPWLINACSRKNTGKTVLYPRHESSPNGTFEIDSEYFSSSSSWRFQRPFFSISVSPGSDPSFTIRFVEIDIKIWTRHHSLWRLMKRPLLRESFFEIIGQWRDDFDAERVVDTLKGVLPYSHSKCQSETQDPRCKNWEPRRLGKRICRRNLWGEKEEQQKA